MPTKTSTTSIVCTSMMLIAVVVSEDISSSVWLFIFRLVAATILMCAYGVAQSLQALDIMKTMSEIIFLLVVGIITTGTKGQPMLRNLSFFFGVMPLFCLAYCNGWSRTTKAARVVAAFIYQEVNASLPSGANDEDLLWRKSSFMFGLFSSMGTMTFFNETPTLILLWEIIWFLGALSSTILALFCITDPIKANCLLMICWVQLPASFVSLTATVLATSPALYPVSWVGALVVMTVWSYWRPEGRSTVVDVMLGMTGEWCSWEAFMKINFNNDLSEASADTLVIFAAIANMLPTSENRPDLPLSSRLMLFGTIISIWIVFHLMWILSAFALVVGLGRPLSNGFIQQTTIAVTHLMAGLVAAYTNKDFEGFVKESQQLTILSSVLGFSVMLILMLSTIIKHKGLEACFFPLLIGSISRSSLALFLHPHWLSVVRTVLRSGTIHKSLVWRWHNCSRARVGLAL